MALVLTSFLLPFGISLASLRFPAFGTQASPALTPRPAGLPQASIEPPRRTTWVSISPCSRA